MSDSSDPDGGPWRGAAGGCWLPCHISPLDLAASGGEPGCPDLGPETIS